MWLGIRNYKPLFCEDTGQLLINHKQALKNLHGEKVLGIWILWNLSEDEWYSDAPIIIRNSSNQLELCANKINEYSITYNSIDIDNQVDPANLGDDELWYFEWRQLEEARVLIGKVITNIEIIELLYETRVLHDAHNPERVGNEYSNWLLHGLCFNLNGDFLALYNAFDTNGVLYEKEIKKEIQYKAVY